MSDSGFSVLLKNVQSIIQRPVQDSAYYSKCPASGSGFRVLFKIRPAYYSASGSVFSVLLKNVQGIIQRPVQYSAYYSGYYIAQDRTKWRGLIKRGDGEYEAKRISEAEQKRAQRKARAFFLRPLLFYLQQAI